MEQTVTNREIDHRIFKILTPIIIENLLMMLSSVILTSYIGRLQVDEISIYGLSTRISYIFFALFRGMGVGVMILAAKAFGEGDRSKCRWIQHQAYMSVFPPAFLITLVIWFFARPVLTVMTTNPVLLDGGEQVLKVISLFMSVQALIGLNAAAFQSFGNTKTPMMIAAFGNLISITTGYALIFGFGPIPAMGLQGAVYALLSSWIGMMLLGFFLIYGPGGLYSGIRSEHKLFDLPEKEDVKSIYRTGVPVAIENSYWNIATVYISRVILMYGSNYYAAYQFGLQAEGVCDVMSVGFLTGSMALASIAIGAKDSSLYRRYYKRLNFFCAIVVALTMAFLFFLTRPILRFLTDKEELVVLAMGYLIAMIFSQWPQHMAKVISGYMRTSGHAKAPMLISLAGIVTRVLLVILFGEMMRLPIIWVWWAFNIDLWLRYLVSLVYGRKMRILDYVDQMEERPGV